MLACGPRASGWVSIEPRQFKEPSKRFGVSSDSCSRRSDCQSAHEERQVWQLADWRRGPSLKTALILLAAQKHDRPQKARSGLEESGVRPTFPEQCRAKRFQSKHFSTCSLRESHFFGGRRGISGKDRECRGMSGLFQRLKQALGLAKAERVQLPPAKGFTHFAGSYLPTAVDVTSKTVF
jgi:hypothetical protein